MYSKTKLTTCDLIGPMDVKHYGVILIHDLDDVARLMEWQKSEVARTWKRVIQSGLKADSYDHFSSATVFKSIWAKMCIDPRFEGELAPIAFDKCFSEYFVNLVEVVSRLKDDEFVVVNKNGGHFTGTPDMIDGKVRPHSVDETSHDIGDYGAKYLVLENDEEVPKEVEDWMKENGKSYGNGRTHSYICNLRQYQDSEKASSDLHMLLLRWCDRTYTKEERAYFVYTTGLDVNQMRWYIDLMAKTPCNQIVWVPSDESDPTRDRPWVGMKEYAEEMGMEVTFMSLED